jgi:hypothetical protein
LSLPSLLESFSAMLAEAGFYHNMFYGERSRIQ